VMQNLNDLPTPKFKIGETVYFASSTTTQETLPCPECLGTGKWKIVTPSGAKFSTYCLRCEGRSFNDLPSLKYLRHVPKAIALTVGSIRIDTANYYGRHIEYMCLETGIGSGSVYGEDKLYPSRDEAMAAAQANADAENAKLEATPERIQQRHIGHIRLTDAIFEKARDAIWTSWYRHNSLREDIEQAIAECDVANLKEELDRHLNFDKKYRDSHPFDKLLEAARSGDQSKIARALEAFPEASQEEVEALP
jgi:hypothetical protein